MEKKPRILKSDVVVIGTGASGLSAAVTAGLGGADVIVFEKMHNRGGMSNFSEGIFGAETHLQKENKIGVTVEQAFKSHMDGTHWLANARLVRNFMDKTASTIEWLESLGVEFAGVKEIYPDGPLVWHMIKGRSAAGLIKPLFEKMQTMKNTQVFFETPVKSITRERGKITGVIAQDRDGNTVHVKTKAVIIASGGFQDNPDWMQKYVKSGRYITPDVKSQQTGDAIQMAWDVGAAPDGLGVTQAFPYVPDELNPKSPLLMAGMHPFLWVNKLGERFCDESIVWRFPLITDALARQPEGRAFCIFDANTKDFLKQQGIQFCLGEFLKLGTKLTNIDQDIKRGIEQGKAL